jgi:hypothetical protein
MDRSNWNGASHASGSYNSDFKVLRREKGSYNLAATSDRGRLWLKNYLKAWHPACSFSLASINAFLAEARKCGMTTEYQGPLGPVMM